MITQQMQVDEAAGIIASLPRVLVRSELKCDIETITAKAVARMEHPARRIVIVAPGKLIEATKTTFARHVLQREARQEKHIGPITFLTASQSNCRDRYREPRYDLVVSYMVNEPRYIAAIHRLGQPHAAFWFIESLAAPPIDLSGLGMKFATLTLHEIKV